MQQTLFRMRNFYFLLFTSLLALLWHAPFAAAHDQHAKKKLLVLIIASDNNPAFIDLQGIWKAYMNYDLENVEAYFIKGDPNISAPFELVEDTIYSKITDSYRPGIVEKTILSMEFALNKEFDYLLRTNLSSFYHFPQLLKFLDTLPKTNCYCARPLVPCYGDVVKEFYNVPFGWGAGFILSRDLVEMLVENKEEVLREKVKAPDDVLIGAFFHRRKIPIISAEWHHFPNYADWQRRKDFLPTNAFHFRAKSHYLKRQVNEDYSDEYQILLELLEKFYPL